MGKGGDVNDDSGGADDHHKDGEGGDAGDGGVNDGAQVVRGVPEEQRLCGDRRD